MFGWSVRLGGSLEPDVVVVTTEPLASVVRDLVRLGRRVEAVRPTRRRAGLTLLPAVMAADALHPDAGPDPGTRSES